MLIVGVLLITVARSTKPLQVENNVFLFLRKIIFEKLILPIKKWCFLFRHKSTYFPMQNGERGEKRTGGHQG
jgi:hypothetical protein